MSKVQRDAEEPQTQRNTFVFEIGLRGKHEYLEYLKLDARYDVNEEESNDLGADCEEEAKNYDVDQLSFENLLNSWVHSCHGFLDAFPVFSKVARFVNHGISAKELMQFLEAEALEKTAIEKEQDERNYTSYTLGLQHLDFAYR